MKPFKHLQVSLLFVSVLLASWGCSEKVAGVTQDENTYAEGESSSSEGDVLSSSSELVLESSSGGNIGCKVAAQDDYHYRYPEYRDVNTNLVYSMVDARAAYLRKSGTSEKYAKSQAYNDLYKAAGLDTLFADTLFGVKHGMSTFYGPELIVYGSELIDYSLKPLAYVFDGMDSLEFQDVQKSFAKTGNIDRTAFCGIFDGRDNYEYMVNETTAFVAIGGCIWGGKEYDNPSHILRMFWRKCLDMPYCDESRRQQFMTAGESNYGIADAEYVCKSSGWEIPDTLDLDTRDKKCGSANVGEFMEIPSGDGYYICREKGWAYATDMEMDTKGVACDEEGKRLKGVFDEKMVYSCHNGEWVKFYEAPCSVDNERIPDPEYNSGNGAYVCYKGKWYQSSEWTLDFPKEYYFNQNIEYGTFVDPRDGRSYKTTEMFGKTWMSENMNYAGENSDEDSSSVCPHKSCEITGRYYSVEGAKEACPDGWRMITPSDMDSLAKGDFKNLSGYEQNLYHGKYFSQIGHSCKIFDCDVYGLSMIPAGYYFEGEFESGMDDHAHLWAQDESGEVSTFLFPHVYASWYAKVSLVYLPVRCVKD